MTALLTLGRLTSHPGLKTGLRTRFRDSQPTINWAAEPLNRTIFSCAISGFIAQLLLAEIRSHRPTGDPPMTTTADPQIVPHQPDAAPALLAAD